MRDIHPLAVPAAVVAAFGLILAGLFVVEMVRPVGKPAAGVTARATSPAPAVPPPPPPEAVSQAADLEMKEREIKAEIDRLSFDLDGYRRDLDKAEKREREHKERFSSAGLEQKARMMSEGVRLGSESLKAGKKVRDTEYRVRTLQRELQDLYKNSRP